MDIWLRLSTIFQGMAFAGLAICFFLGLLHEYAVKSKKIKKNFLSIISMCFLTTVFFTLAWLISLGVASDNFCA